MTFSFDNILNESEYFELKRKICLKINIQNNMRSLSIIICSLFFSGALMAQPLNKETLASMLQTAEEQMALKDYYNALEWYEKAEEESGDVALNVPIAELSYMLRDYRKATKAYSRLLKRDKKNEYAELRFEYARALKMNGEPKEAIEEFDKYLKYVTDPVRKTLAEAEKKGAEYALTATEDTKDLSVSNAGKDVNTKTSEYQPFIGVDGKTLYYSTLATDEIVMIDEKAEDYHAKIYTSSAGDKGWEKGTALGENINRPGYHISNVRLSPNGKQMFYCQQLLEGNVLKESKIYMSTDKGGTWSAGNEVAGINIEGTLSKSPAVGELFGKKVLFFASTRDGGEGGWDLYYATEKGEGQYGDPVNLGPRINTVGDEIDGFYRDGMLYFSSNGHPTIGGFDIFQSEWNGVRWGDPKNMGLGFNSPADDLGFMLDQEGYRGVLASNRIAQGSRSVKSKTCCDDIYNINLRKIEVDLVAVALDSLSKEPLSGVTMELVILEDGKEIKVDRRTNSSGNDFAFDIELDKAYKIIASASNYETKTAEFNTIGIMDNKTLNEMLTLKPLPKTITITSETPFVLENILYDFNKDNIRSDAEPSLEFIYEIMMENPDMKIELSSHTDARGSDAANQSLAQRRAESARRWLLAKNEGAIKRFRITAKGYGESVPQTVSAEAAAKHSFLKEGDVLTEAFINSIEGEENQEIAHQLNRRTEFKITDGPKSIIIEETRLIQLGNKKVDEKIDETIKKSNDKQSMPKEKAQEVPKSTPKPQPKAAPKQTAKPAFNGDIHRYSSLYGRKNLKGVPILQFDNRNIELGKVKKGETREHTYHLTNVGDTTAEIDLISACDCTTTNESKRTIKPGDSATIHIVFNSKDKSEAETIDIDIYLKNVTPDDEMPIIETIKYSFDIVK